MVSTQQRDSDDDVSIDFSKLKSFFSPKTISILLLVLLIAIPVILTAYIRLQAWNIPATDGWAKSSVDNYYRNQIAQSVTAQYPNLPTAQREQLITQQYTEFKKTNKAQIDAQVQQTSAYFKTGMQYEENGNTYTFLGDLDSYFYLRYARNVEKTGVVCDIVDSKGACIDTHMWAPLTSEAGASLHPYATVYLYRFLHFFNAKVNLMQAAFILPTIIAMIAAIAAFFIGRRLMNNTAGFFAAIFIAVSPLLVTRTMGSDTDIWNIMFPMVIIWLFLEAFETKRLWVKLTLTAATGLALAFFNFAWGGWWYIFYFILAALIGYIGFIALKKYLKHKSLKHIFDTEMRDTLFVLGILFFSTAFFVTIIYSFNNFTNALQAPFMFSETLKVAVATQLWPNVLTTVAELNEAGLTTIVGQVSFGIAILFSLAALGIIFTLVKRKPDTKDYILIAIAAVVYLFLISTTALNLNYKLYLVILLLPVLLGLWFVLRDEKTHDIKPALILMIWFIGMIYTSTKGIRFILLLIPAFSIALGVAIGYFYQYFARIFNESFHMKEKLAQFIVFILLCLILIAPISIGINAGKSYVPSITKGWWDSLSKIREESKPDAIITSWWDFGHWFKYVADRRVTFDGASQLPPIAMWVGHSLQTNSEQETVGILRMLACGSNKAFEEVDKKFNDTEKSQNIVADILLLNRADAESYLKKHGFTNQEIIDILQYSHCTPPDVYYITSEDMVGKAGVWGHFGTWDIDRAYIINNVRPESFEVGTRLLKERFNYSDEEAAKIYYEVQALSTDRQMNDWIAPWPGYAGNMVTCTESKNMTGIILCQTNLNLGSNGQANVVIERAVINLTNPLESVVSVGFFDGTNRRVGQNVATFQKIVIADNNYTTYTPQNATFTFGLLLNINRANNQTTYSAIVADQLLIDSTFTKLFFLDGKNMNHFEKFSEITDITGTKIIVWKVKW
ncbi:MAG: STT3 domain-containing protein [Candidatus Woesearchaeota archaeon]